MVMARKHVSAGGKGCEFSGPAGRVLGLVVGLWLLAHPVMAAIECDASVNRTSVPSGGEVILTVTAAGDVGWSPEFQLPDMPGVRVYAGGTNQSMSVTNGRTETTVSRVYYLKIETTADFTIGQVSVTSGNKSCRTEPIAIKVTPMNGAGTQIPPANSGNRVQRPGESPNGAVNSEAGKAGDSVFVTLEADHTEAWVGQQIVLTFRYWRRVQPWNNPNFTPPRTEGFWRENLGSERNYRQVVKGRAYTVTEIRYAVFPTRIGDLVIEPAELNFPRGAFDSFFQSRRNRRGPSTLRTDPVTIHVKELPQPQPAGYSGIVASQLKLISQVDRDTIPRGEALGLKVRLDSDGFLKGFSNLAVPVPPKVRMHDAGESFRTGAEGGKLKGHIVVEKVIVPDQDGELHLPPVELVWFDVKAGRYRTARTAAWDVVVTASDLPLAGADESGFLRSEISRLGEDLAFIHPAPASLSRRTGPLTGRAIWWGLLILPGVLLGMFRFYLRRLAAELRDPAGRRARGALTAARNCLAAQEGDMMPAVARAICGYVADCQDRTFASVGPAAVLEFCAGLGAPETGERLVAILDECDAARYGGSGPESAARVVEEVGGLLATLDAGRRSAHRRRGTSAATLAILGIALCLAVAPLQAADQAERPGTDPVRLLAEGNQAYTEGRLDDAQSRYLAARDRGVNDPVLHFNLGNTYARTGHLGQAIASYLRAQRLAPRDKDVRNNLFWVRRHIRDLELSEHSLPLFIAQLAGIVGALTVDQWGIGLIALAWLVAALIGWGWYRDDFNPRLRRLLLTGGAALILVAAVTAGRWYVEEVRDSAVVIVPEVEVRSGPATSFSALFKVHDGLTLTIDERRAGWARVGLGGDWEGWVPEPSIEPVRRAAGAQGR